MKISFEDNSGWFWRWRPAFADKNERELEICAEENFAPKESYGNFDYQSMMMCRQFGNSVFFFSSDENGDICDVIVFDLRKKRPDVA